MRKRSTTHLSLGNTWLLQVWVGLIMAFSACGDAGLPCDGPENCPGDMACVQGVCKERTCISSLDCSLEQHCDTTIGDCVDGCFEDSDCKFGETCHSGVCTQSPCTSTTIDCQAGQYCDAATGTCFEAAGPYCTPCTTSEDCGGGDNRCMYVGGTGPYCLPVCSTDRPCPAGFDCVPLSSSGEIVSYYCVALCGYINTADPDAWMNDVDASSGKLEQVPVAP